MVKRWYLSCHLITTIQLGLDPRYYLKTRVAMSLESPIYKFRIQFTNKKGEGHPKGTKIDGVKSAFPLQAHNLET